MALWISINLFLFKLLLLGRTKLSGKTSGTGFCRSPWLSFHQGNSWQIRQNLSSRSIIDWKVLPVESHQVLAPSRCGEFALTLLASFHSPALLPTKIVLTFCMVSNDLVIHPELKTSPSTSISTTCRSMESAVASSFFSFGLFPFVLEIGYERVSKGTPHGEHEGKVSLQVWLRYVHPHWVYVFGQSISKNSSCREILVSFLGYAAGHHGPLWKIHASLLSGGPVKCIVPGFLQLNRSLHNETRISSLLLPFSSWLMVTHPSHCSCDLWKYT